MYTTLDHYIDGKWVKPSGKTLEVYNPANSKVIGELGSVSKGDLDMAIAAAEKGFKQWRKVSAFERGKMLRKIGDLVRARADEIAKVLTMEQGKVLAEAKIEVLMGADIFDWFAAEGQRAYGRIIPARADGVRNMVIMEPIGPVAGFSPWNFPITQAVRKIAAALAAGCSIIVKCPEETPGSPIGLLKCIHDAGVPAGVVNLIYGVPAEISEYLIPHPSIRKISFTGSVPVGKHLAALAATHMKRATMELGGHAPVLVFDDADVESATKIMLGSKFRNAGQVCISPTRFFVHEKVYDKFVGDFISGAKALKLGDGLDASSTMGPLANPRRVNAMESIIADAQEKGAKVQTGGKRLGNQGRHALRESRRILFVRQHPPGYRHQSREECEDAQEGEPDLQIESRHGSAVSVERYHFGSVAGRRIPGQDRSRCADPAAVGSGRWQGRNQRRHGSPVRTTGTSGRTVSRITARVSVRAPRTSWTDRPDPGSRPIGAGSGTMAKRTRVSPASA